MTKKYKIHTAYVNANGSIVKEGVYEEGTFDLGEARYKSIVTLVDVILKEKNIKTPDNIPVQKFNQDSDLRSIRLESEIKVKQYEPLKINSADLDKLQELKYVSKKTAEQIIKERSIKPFESYGDLDKRVPLKPKKAWEDIALIDFEEIVGHKTENSIYYSDGTVPLS